MKKGFPRSNVLKFLFEDGSWVAVSPSGTEPKCKFYYSAVADSLSPAKAKLDELKNAIVEYTNIRLFTITSDIFLNS